MDQNTNPVPQPEQTQPAPNLEERMPNAEMPEAASVESSAPSQDRLPTIAESAPAPAATPALATPVPTAPPTTPGAAAAGVTSTPNPALADDVDVIEKEWVDQAERVIKATADDPHAEEEAVEDLQIDYMKKRYGKDIKKSE